MQRPEPVAGRDRLVRRMRGAQGFVGIDADEGVQLFAVLLDTGEIELYQFGRLPTGELVNRIKRGQSNFPETEALSGKLL